MKTSEIPQALLKVVFEQAEREYPRECCGMILGPRQKEDRLTRLRPCRNAYDAFHAQDPDNFPRTAQTAYFIDPKELLAIQKEIRERDEAIYIIYHSHINTDAYFSAEDKQVAISEGEPAYPGVCYLVISVMQGKVQGASLYQWDDHQKDFLL